MYNSILTYAPAIVRETIELQDQYFKVKEAREKTQEKEIPSDLKEQRWNDLKIALFADVISGIYVQQLLNLFNLVLFAVSGKAYLAVKEKSNEEQKQFELTNNEVHNIFRKRIVFEWTQSYILPLIKEEVERTLGPVPLRTKVSGKEVDQTLYQIHKAILGRLFEMKLVKKGGEEEEDEMGFRQEEDELSSDEEPPQIPSIF